jgi:Mg-chelatase subunit ChlD
MNTVSYKISKDLYLVRHSVAGTPKPAKACPTNHIFVVDCSGSMTADLPKLREHLKKKLPKLLREDDTLSILWFSGKGEFGVLLENEPVATLKDLQAVHAAIDRWLKPIGLTGFKEPLEEAKALVSRIEKKRPGSVSSLIFLTDGQDNCWGASEILKALAAHPFASSTFVEYGYYAGRTLLAQMAEKSGGSLIFAESFDTFTPNLDRVLQKPGSSTKLIDCPVEAAAVGGFVFAMVGEDLLTFAAPGSSVHVPENLAEFAYVSSRCVGKEVQAIAEGHFSPLYAALALYALRMRSDVVFPLLALLGDVRLIEQYSTCFGKQAYSDFMEEARRAAFAPDQRLVRGYNPKLVPREDSFTVLEALALLQHDDASKVLLDDKHFAYTNIGRGRLDADEVLVPSELEEKERLAKAITETRDPQKLKDWQSELSSLLEGKRPALKLVYDPVPEGVSVHNLTFNEERPNVSLLVRRPATVDLSRHLPDHLKPFIPSRFPTSVFRNYTIVKDGLVNVATLPVSLSPGTLDVLRGYEQDGRASLSARENHLALFHLRTLPILNRSQIKAVSAKFFFESKFALMRARAAQKVYGYFADKHAAKGFGWSFVAKYNAVGATWLHEQGFSENGYQPLRTTVAPKTDHYMGKKLVAKLPGLSDLPSVEEAKERIAKGGKKPLPISVAMMKEWIDKAETIENDRLNEGMSEAFSLLAKNAVAMSRGHILSIAKTTFAILVGQTWFQEFAGGLEDNALTIATEFGPLACKVEMREIEIPI